MFSLFPLPDPTAPPMPGITLIGSLSLGKRGDPPAQPIKLSIPWDDLQPTFDLFSVMRWSTQVSDFVGRDDEMTALWDWAISEPKVSAKFVVAPGGMGKTRLAAEFAQQRIEDGWSAGFVRLNEPTSFYVSKNGLLLLVDYPEQHPKETRELLENLSSLGAEAHVRVLLLSRSDPDEWTDMLNEAHVRAKVDMTPLRLNPLRGEAAHELYTSALEKLQEQFGLGGEAVSVEALEDWVKQSPENERALFVLAASVYEATTPGGAEIKYAGREIVTSLADREIQRLREAAKAVGLDGASGTHPNGLARLVAMAAIYGPVPLKTVKAWTANQDLKLGLGDAEMIGERLREVHLARQPHKEDGEATSGVVSIEAAYDADKAAKSSSSLLTGSTEVAVLPPEPDIVAAALLHMVLFAEGNDDPVANPERLWGAIEPDPSNAFSRIERLADDMHYVLGRDTTPLRDGLERMVEQDVQRCRIAHPALRDVRLPQVFLPMMCSACNYLLLQEENIKVSAVLYNDLSIYEDIRGETLNALTASQRAVEVCRKIVEENPSGFHSMLAASLTNLSKRYTDLGRHTEALAISEESVLIRQALFNADSRRYRSDLAQSLNNLSVGYFNLGRYNDALKGVKRVERLYLMLAEENPARFLSDLCTILNNKSAWYSTVGQHESALEAIEEAVQIRRALAENNAARHRPSLAGYLCNLSTLCSLLGRHEEALLASKEALQLRRLLAAENPTRFRPDLADSLNNLSAEYSELGRHEEALNAIEEGVKILSELAARNPSRFRPDLAGSLHNLSNQYFKLGRVHEAFNSIENALTIYHQLAAENPSRFDARLGASYIGRGNCLYQSGQHDEACTCWQKAKELLRPYSEKWPESEPGRWYGEVVELLEDKCGGN